jgi:asparagine synthetase B (glutamine-hydrolysing)
MCEILILNCTFHCLIKHRNKFIDAINLLDYRGSDDSGEWRSDGGRVCFAHKRLSIVDFNDNGHL